MKLSLKRLFLCFVCVVSACTTEPHEQTNYKTLDMSDLSQVPDNEALPREKAIASPTVKNLFPAQETQALYRCPMHPQIVQDHPGNCHICGMDLEKVEQTSSDAGTSLQERAAVQINATRQQLIGLKTAQIKRRTASSTVRTVARVAHSEQRISHVHTKYAGWLEKVHANFEGQYVKRGQALAEIYSPELVAAQKEFIVALDAAEQFKDSGFLNSESTVKTLVEAAEEKLRLYDLMPTQIEHLRKTGQIKRTLTLYAPKTGYVTQLNAVDGMRVTAGTTLYSVANLSEVWVKGRIYENDVADVKVGQEVRVTLPFHPDLVYSGHISYIDPILDPKTRTLEVRVVLPNSEETLKPEMFANLEIIVRKSAAVLTIPAAAVIQTGKQNIAFLAKKEGYFEPRELKLGRRVGEGFELIAGLEAGNRVVTDAQFLVDSESQMQSVVSQMQGGGNHVH